MLPQMQLTLSSLTNTYNGVGATLVEICWQKTLWFIPMMIEETEDNPQDDFEKSCRKLFTENGLRILQRILDEEFHHLLTEGGEFRKQRASESNIGFGGRLSIFDERFLFQHLMKQAKETFETKEELTIAEWTIGNLDSRGFLTTLISEIIFIYRFQEDHVRQILKKIQTFDPFGIAASSLQESLLIQLQCLGKENSLAYKIIEKFYDDLLHNRLPVIQKSLDCSLQEIEAALKQQISHLDLIQDLVSNKFQ